MPETFVNTLCFTQTENDPISSNKWEHGFHCEYHHLNLNHYRILQTLVYHVSVYTVIASKSLKSTQNEQFTHGNNCVSTRLLDTIQRFIRKICFIISSSRGHICIILEITDKFLSFSDMNEAISLFNNQKKVHFRAFMTFKSYVRKEHCCMMRKSRITQQELTTEWCGAFEFIRRATSRLGQWLHALLFSGSHSSDKCTQGH